MKSRLLLLAILAVGLTAIYCGLARPHVTTIPSYVREPLADLKPPELPPLEPPPLIVPATPVLTLPAPRPGSRVVLPAGKLEVPIQDGATTDFSTGAPVVKRGGKEQDDLAQTIREMTEAARGTTFEAKK